MRTLKAYGLASKVGIIFFNAHTGRGGEWAVIKLEHVQKQIREGLDYLSCPEHKTAWKYGSAGKWLAPGTWKAVMAFIQCSYRGTGWFFEPPRTISWRVGGVVVVGREGWLVDGWGGVEVVTSTVNTSKNAGPLSHPPTS